MKNVLIFIGSLMSAVGLALSLESQDRNLDGRPQMKRPVARLISSGEYTQIGMGSSVVGVILLLVGSIESGNRL